MGEYLYSAIPTHHARYIQDGGFDANGQVAEESISDGSGNQCRHCLEFIEKGKEMLTCSYRPFLSPQPYAESGPVFVHKEKCKRRVDSQDMPSMYREWEAALLRGYDNRDRIIYGTGEVVRVSDIESGILRIFSNPSVVYIHLRSSTNNCFQCRIERDGNNA